MTITIIDPLLGVVGAAILGAAVPQGVKRKITKFVAYNGNAGAASIKVFIVPVGQAADSPHCYVDYDMQARETYLCPEVIGQVLAAGGNIYVQGAGVYFSAVTNDMLNN